MARHIGARRRHPGHSTTHGAVQPLNPAPLRSDATTIPVPDIRLPRVVRVKAVVSGVLDRHDWLLDEAVCASTAGSASARANTICRRLIVDGLRLPHTTPFSSRHYPLKTISVCHWSAG